MEYEDETELHNVSELNAVVNQVVPRKERVLCSGSAGVH